MNGGRLLVLRNAERVPLGTVPLVPVNEFREMALAAARSGARMVAFFGRAVRDRGDAVRLVLVLADREPSGTLAVLSADVSREYPALTPEWPEAHRFEREIAETCGIMPAGHPWLKPVRSPVERGIGTSDFFQVQGGEVHEVAVGPVHAGIIEPGHFRFQCDGEEVLHLEISLGYQHRGVERALAGGPNGRTLHYMETLAGDTTIGHATAYCCAVEALSGCRVPLRADMIRAVALELERLANHTGDLGALAGDIGYLPTMSYCGRIRGDFLNMTALMTGNRFGRGLMRPGGVGFDLDEARVAELEARLEAALRDVDSAVRLLWDSPSVMARFDGTGTLTSELSDELGLVGPAARASGIGRDVRHEFPAGLYRFAQIPLSTWHTGDVAARAHVRWLEIRQSAEFIHETLEQLAAGPVVASNSKGTHLEPESFVVTLAEGWRGEIAHVASTDARGRFDHYKVVDPSFHNWGGLAMAMRGERISDFPLVNKSFNLSYCGHDL